MHMQCIQKASIHFMSQLLFLGRKRSPLQEKIQIWKYCCIWYSFKAKKTKKRRFFSNYFFIELFIPAAIWDSYWLISVEKNYFWPFLKILPKVLPYCQKGYLLKLNLSVLIKQDFSVLRRAPFLFSFCKFTISICFKSVVCKLKKK